METLFISVMEAAEALGLSRSQLYKEFAAGRLPYVKAGARTLVPTTAIRDFADRLVAESATA